MTEAVVAPKQDEETLRQLIAGSGEVFDNPILMRIIQAAPSPHAADRHIQQLGWPNDLAREVRNAARIKERFPKTWADLSTSSVRPADGLFKFVPVDFWEGMEMSESLHFGGISVAKDWPFFLRDFRSPSGITTFDGKGDSKQLRSFFTSCRDLTNPFLLALDSSRLLDHNIIASRTFGGSQFFHRSGNFKDLIFSIHRDCSCYDFRNENLTIIGSWVEIEDQMEPSAKVMPGFWKVVEVRKGTEKIRVFLRMDVGEDFRPKYGAKQEKNTAGLIFTKVVPVARDERTTVVLSLGFSVEKDFSLRPEPAISGQPLIAVQREFYTSGFPIREIDLPAANIAQAVAELSDLVLKIYRRQPALDHFVGVSIADFPPENLHGLFVQE